MKDDLCEVCGKDETTNRHSAKEYYKEVCKRCHEKMVEAWEKISRRGVNDVQKV